MKNDSMLLLCYSTVGAIQLRLLPISKNFLSMSLSRRATFTVDHSIYFISHMILKSLTNQNWQPSEELNKKVGSKHPWITKGVSKKLQWEMASLLYKTILLTHKQLFRCIVAIKQAHHFLEHWKGIEEVSKIMDEASKEPQRSLNRSSEDYQKRIGGASKEHRRSIKKHYTGTTLRKLGWKLRKSSKENVKTASEHKTLNEHWMDQHSRILIL